MVVNIYSGEDSVVVLKKEKVTHKRTRTDMSSVHLLILKALKAVNPFNTSICLPPNKNRTFQLELDSPTHFHFAFCFKNFTHWLVGKQHGCVLSSLTRNININNK